ncbi:ABC transporter permease [Bartonella sp. HY406]|uniref:ABC transporter permease n=1 Tax=Bartonella sp. HY406 TaxID=2979331 RepID=UPI0021C980C2|nr:ABC transporter permease [Bartonella sp. HY406]UXN03631.1 ABC transporter permease [Bartonella sp. HY406]
MSDNFYIDSFFQILSGAPLTLQLAAWSVFLGMFFALLLAGMRLSGLWFLDWTARFYIFIFRGTPFLVQIFIIYYGLSQFPTIRYSFLWPILREPYWCAIIALMLNHAAYGSEIIRGGLRSVSENQVEAAYACGMSRFTCFRRVVLPLAIRQALPAYGNEIILMVKTTSLASAITLLEITGIAGKIIAETYRAVDVFIIAGAIYLAINFILTRCIAMIEYRLNAHQRPPVEIELKVLNS